MKEVILRCTVQDGDQFLCNISLRFIVHVVYYNTRSKRVNKEVIPVQEEDQFLCNISLRFIVHIVYLFLHGYGLHYNTRSKRVNEENYRKTMQNFRFNVRIVYLMYILCHYVIGGQK